jgi:tRNA nucleotidyltransferase (CCA-adding enzyme)
MRIVVGHANPDFDAYASTVAAARLFEGARCVFLGTQNANVRAFHNLHEEFLDFVDVRALDVDAIDSVIMVDTRDASRIGEMGVVALRPGVEVIVYDHHPPQEGDILVQEIKRRNLDLSVLEASLFLLGIHEDTGSLTYPSATAYDADAAAWLMASGADLEVLNRFLSRTLEPAQLALLEQLQNSLELWDINGQQIAVGTAHADEYVDSASVLTHYVVEDMGYRVAIAFVEMPGRLQVVARSRLPEVDVGAVMARIGGGGHAQAASAGFRDQRMGAVVSAVRAALKAEVTGPLHASDVMSAPVRTVGPETTMRQAGELMARWGHGGLPVVEDGALVGLVTRKDIDKALRHKLQHAPVKGFMGSELVTVTPDVDLPELERLLATRGIGRVPVLVNGAIVGIVTRKDVLRAAHGESYLDHGTAHAHPEATQAFLGGVETLLPHEVRAALTALGTVGVHADYAVHVVGGFVRDMVLGRRNLDIDLVVEGDGIAFAEKAAEELGIRIKVHRRFGTAVLVFSKDLHVDVASSRSEYYTKPGALPTVERSSLRQDLFRRDFTINAMAACLDPGCYGRLMDPFGGLGDLKRRTVRAMHALSFIEDPTRILRAARFEERYGFSMDAHTRQLAGRAITMGVLDEVSGARVRDELYDILAEKDPALVFARLGQLGAAEVLLPHGVSPDAAHHAVSSAQSAFTSESSRFSRTPARRAVLVAAIGGLATAVDCDRWITHLRMAKEHADAARVLAMRGAVIRRTLADRRGMRDSRLRHLLFALTDEALLALWATSDHGMRVRIDHYIDDVIRVVPAVSGADLIALGATPGEGFSAILARALDDRLDGRVVGREAELANLRRLAVRVGLIPSGKDSV